MVFLLLRSYSKLAPFGNFKNGSPRGFLPRPLLRADKIQKQISLGFAKIQSPENSFRKTESELKPRHTARISLWAEPQRKMSFPFSKKIGRAQIRKARNIFLWGCRAERGGGGAFVERTI